MTADGFIVHPNCTPETRNIFQRASTLAASDPTPTTSSKSKKVWDKFIKYARNKGFSPFEATPEDVVTWVIERSQQTGTPSTVEFELWAISAWRLQIGKPLGNIPFELSAAKGLLNLVDPSESGILGFPPNQLHALFLKAVTEDKTYLYFASLRQISSLCAIILGYWEVRRSSGIKNG